MNKEALFAQALQQIKDLAREQGGMIEEVQIA